MGPRRTPNPEIHRCLFSQRPGKQRNWRGRLISRTRINALAGLAKMVVVKRGPAAAICRKGGEQWSLLPPSVNVVDQMGAGDSFNAGFYPSIPARSRSGRMLGLCEFCGCLLHHPRGGNGGVHRSGKYDQLLPHARLSSRPRGQAQGSIEVAHKNEPEPPAKTPYFSTLPLGRVAMAKLSAPFARLCNFAA